jgi:hypothetical protein
VYTALPSVCGLSSNSDGRWGFLGNLTFFLFASEKALGVYRGEGSEFIFVGGTAAAGAAALG